MRIAHGARSYADGIERVQTNCDDWVSVTRQDQAHLVNINNIYRKTQFGELPIGAAVLPTYGDFLNSQSYDESLNFILKAQEAFMELPAELRRQFNDDAGKWYEHTVKAAQDAHEATLKEESDRKIAESKQKALSDAQALIAANGLTP